MANLQKIFGGPRQFLIIFLFAAVIGLIHVSHNFLIPLELGHIAPDNIYRPMTIQSNYDIGTFYAARVKAVAARGQIFSGDVNLAEYPNTPSSVPFLPSAILGVSAKFLGSVERAIIFSDFVFPALAFVIVYLLIFRFIKKYWLALSGAVFFIFLPGWEVLVTSPSVSGWREILYRVVPFFDTQSALIFLRFDYPKLTEVFYAAALLLFYENLRRPGRIGLVLASGISFGALLYIYLYNGLYMFMGVSFLILGLLLFKEYARAVTVFKIFGIALLMSVPYWSNFISLHNLSQYNDILWRLGVEVTHSFRWTSWTSIARALVLSVLVWVLGAKENRIRSIYLISFLIPIIFALNIQVVTGINPAPDHWHRAQFLPVSLALLLFINMAINAWGRSHFAGKYSLYLRRTPIVLVIIFLAMQIVGQWLFSTNSKVVMKYGVPEAFIRSYKWLDDAQKGSVVGTLSAETDAEIAMYTNRWIYIPRAFNTIAGTDELWSRTINLAEILRLNADEFRDLFGRDSDLTSFVFGDLYRSRELNSIFRSEPRDVPAEVLDEKALILANKDFSVLAYKLDYLYVGPRELALYKNKTPDFESIFGPPVYSQDGIRIYKIGN